MTLTRLAFFKLLAAVGIGQAARKHDRIGDPYVGKVFSQDLPPCSLKNPCLSSGDITRIPAWTCQALDGRVVECAAKEGEEYCPLGHPQKPRVILVQEMIEIDSFIASGDGKLIPTKLPVAAGNSAVRQHVCSVCGIVYVK